MKKEEIENRIKELENRIEELKFKIDQDDILQYAIKILMNSAYGAISSKNNPISDVDLANAITMSGSCSIQQVNRIVYNYVKCIEIEKIKSEIKKLEINS